MSRPLREKRRLDKRRSALVVLVPALLLLALTTQTWATGTARDVLSHGTVDVSGGGAAPGVVGLAVVCAVALLGLMTGGRLIRVLSSVFLALASIGTLALVVLVAARPTAAVAAQVAVELARTTAPAAAGRTTAAGWAALGVSLLLVAGAVMAAVSSRSWSGLSGRYERGAPPERGPRGEVRSTWDELTEGHDPTLRDGPDQT